MGTCTVPSLSLLLCLLPVCIHPKFTEYLLHPDVEDTKLKRYCSSQGRIQIPGFPGCSRSPKDLGMPSSAYSAIQAELMAGHRL